MSSPEGYQPSQEEIYNAESNLDDRQRELTSVRENSLSEGKRITAKSIYPEDIREAINSGRTSEIKVNDSGRIGEDRDEFKRVRLEGYGRLSQDISDAITDYIRPGSVITLVREVSGNKIIGVLSSGKLLWERPKETE